MNDFGSLPMSPISFPSGKGTTSNLGTSQYPYHDKHSPADQGKHLPRVSSSKQTTNCSFDVSNDRYTADESLDLSSANHLQRSLLTVKRKETARRQLMCSMYTKHNSVKRSFSFVAGERPSEVKFPSVNYSEDETKWTYGKKERTRHHKNATKRNTNTSPDYKYMTFVAKPVSKQPRKGMANGAGQNKVNLPEIIMDFNYETNAAQNGRRTMMTSLSDSDDEERAIGAPYEEYLKNTKLLANNPYKARHRPVTPGLLESLNKLRLPSKTKTEQWLKSVTNTRKSYCDDTYRVGNLVNSNLAIPNWIYTDT